MESSYAKEAEFALEIVSQAGRLCRQIQLELGAASIQKEDRTPVTIADFASQALVAGQLQGQFPRDPVVAEEGSGWLRQPENEAQLAQIVESLRPFDSGVEPNSVLAAIDHGAGDPGPRFWTLDPIDGTAGFLRGEQWVVALALIEEGEVKVAAVAAPALSPDLDPAPSTEGRLALAVRGEGSWIGPLGQRPQTRLVVSAQTNPARAHILGSVVDRHTDPARMRQLQAELGAAEALVKVDSQAKFLLLAGGAAEFIFRLLSPQRANYREKIWDQAAGSLIVEEAGGMVTDLHGRNLDFSTGRELTRNRGVFVSNGVLHAHGLEALRRVGAGG